MTPLQGFSYHAGYLDQARQSRLLTAIRAVVAHSPFYTPTMPRSGKPLSVNMTNCGQLGWITDKDKGYRYEAEHPLTHQPWLPIPDEILCIWHELANYPLLPEACLINYYQGTSRLGSHKDSDEKNTRAPVVSVSLGDDAVFHIGGLKRTDPKQRLTLRSGDVVILGGASRLAFHGVDKILPGTSTLLRHGGRINLTLRRVTLRAGA